MYLYLQCLCISICMFSIHICISKHWGSGPLYISGLRRRLKEGGKKQEASVWTHTHSFVFLELYLCNCMRARTLGWARKSENAPIPMHIGTLMPMGLRRLHTNFGWIWSSNKLSHGTFWFSNPLHKPKFWKILFCLKLKFYYANCYPWSY